MAGRLLVIGDVHGCLNTLKVLLDRVKLREDDEIVFVGDYVDRGSRVFDTIEFLIDLNKKHNCTFLKGNHEDMWIRYLKKHYQYQEVDIFFYNGGKATFDQYCDALDLPKNESIDFEDLPEDHQEFYNNLKVMHEVDEYIFVHAGLRPNIPLEEQSDHDMLWIRDTFLYHPLDIIPNRIIVHGHTPMDSYKLESYNQRYTDKINVDSGCIYGYNLTCRNLRGVERWTQKMIDVQVA